MKVCTDSCILGAYTKINHEVKRVLDIGTGTGLLALMLAQKTNALIEGVEIDKDAFEQARINVEESKWNDKICLHHSSIQEFASLQSKSFDLIICNPPFYKNYLPSSDQKFNVAGHSISLTEKDLLVNVLTLLNKEIGEFYCMYPPYEGKVFQIEAEKRGLFLKKRLIVKNSAKDEPLRVIMVFSFLKSDVVEETLVIKNKEGSYTEEFSQLLKEYYLIF